ncbi:Pre mRNA splicing regulator female lethal2D [Echinococcus multilocularis]|uniref:Pre mRNA splicing regulator female lethal2D n=1 Tax=Echinococcus multilocularis TaxID=6211 RepID=A0A087VZS4_ECHMU|nr:Pre mRNA splicing regulator female lethal2D [Echinococcus multilocularis]
MELLAEEQTITIKQLELKLKKIEEENERLIEKQKAQEEDLSRREADVIRRFLVSNVRLAHVLSVLPSKLRRKSSDSEFDYDGADDPADEYGEAVGSVKVKELTHRLNVIDPAIDFVYQKACEAAQSGKMRLQQSYDDLIAWKFTPDSASGKRLMACMRKLLEQNKHLGAINQMDRLAALESETQVQVSCILEYMKTAQELNAVLQESSTDLDGVQSSLFTLKKQLNKAEALVNVLKEEYEKVNPGQSDSLITAALTRLSQQAMAAESENTETEEVEGGEPREDGEAQPLVESTSSTATTEASSHEPK